MLCALVVATVALGSSSLPASQRAAAADAILIEVTSSADTLASPACPDATRCTLRRAIESANADTSGSGVRIGFAQAAFPPENPGTITLGAVPLPVVTTENVIIDGVGRGVRLAGVTQSPTPSVNGIVMSGARAAIRGLEVRGFAGNCIHLAGPQAVAGGDPVLGEGNVIDDCAVGIRVDGAGSRIDGNSIGLSPGTVGAASVVIGLWVTASDSMVGEAASGEGHANNVENATVAVRVGGVGTAALTGVRVASNTVGGSTGAAVPVQTGIEVLAPASGVLLTANALRNAARGITVHPGANKVSISQNTFFNIAGLAIDLNADGLRNPNDDGDADTGANGLRNAPAFSRAVQSRLSGTACGGCHVQIYLAFHLPGSDTDYGTEPVPGTVVVADANGSFAIDNPPVTPGQWLVALATDSDGNTSEFSASTRVGAGNVQCGNPSIVPGWNLVGYFGSEGVNLGGTFPADGVGAGLVKAIYQLDASTGTYARWLSDTAAGRTLTSLQPGEAYWMLAGGAVTLPGGFSLSIPVPATLHAGWNTFVYIGASAAVLDALASLAGRYTELYAWDSTHQEWNRHGGPGAPAWVADFTDIQACSAYEVFLTQDVLLTPLQP